MTAAAILSDLSRAGIEIEASGERLRFTASRPVSAAERQMLAEHKPALLAQLAAEDALRAHLHALAVQGGIPAAVVAALSGGTLAGLLGASDDTLAILLAYYRDTMRVRGELADADNGGDAGQGRVIDVATPTAAGKLAVPGIKSRHYPEVRHG